MKPGRSPAQLHMGARRHAVEASVKVTKEGRVVLEVLRESRQRAAGDLSLELPRRDARGRLRARVVAASCARAPGVAADVAP